MHLSSPAKSSCYPHGMAGETPTPEAPAPVEAPAVVAPAVEAPPVVAPEAAPAEIAPEPAPAADPAATEEKPAEPGASEAKLAEAAEKPAEPPKTAEVKADAEKPAEPQPTAYEFKLPEGITPAEEQMNAFQGVLGKIPGITQERGQELLDLHAASLQAMQAQMEQRQRDVFAETRAGWVKQFQKQAGNRRDTILSAAKSAITGTLTDAKERAEFMNVVDFTGMGDHPAFINMMAKIEKRLSERSAPAKGLPTNGAKSGAPWDKRYGSTPAR